MKLKQRLLAEASFAPWVFAGFVFLLLIPFKRKKSLRILVFTQSKIGDFVSQTPIFREIKRCRPQAHISAVFTNPALKDLIRCDPHVDNVIVWNENAGRLHKLKFLLRLMRENYTWSFNLASQSWVDFIVVYALVPHRITLVPIRSELFLRFFYALSLTKLVGYPIGNYSTSVYLGMLQYLGITTQETERRLFVCPDNETFVQNAIEKFGLKKGKALIGLTVSCGNKLKQMPIGKLAQLADLLIEHYKATVVFLGGGQDKEIASAVQEKMRYRGFDGTGFFSLGQLAAFCTKLDIFISVDSGPLYIANAVGAPVVDIAGPCDLTEQLKTSAKVKIIKSTVPCAPCSFAIAPARTCRVGHRECLEHIEVEGIVKAAGELLAITG